jgi:hypothetical protein
LPEEGAQGPRKTASGLAIGVISIPRDAPLTAAEDKAVTNAALSLKTSDAASEVADEQRATQPEITLEESREGLEGLKRNSKELQENAELKEKVERLRDLKEKLADLQQEQAQQEQQASGPQARLANALQSLAVLLTLHACLPIIT